LLAGCGDYVWVKPDTSEQQMREDVKKCARSAPDDDALDRAFQRCMREAGYSKAPKR